MGRLLKTSYFLPMTPSHDVSGLSMTSHDSPNLHHRRDHIYILHCSISLHSGHVRLCVGLCLRFVSAFSLLSITIPSIAFTAPHTCTFCLSHQPLMLVVAGFVFRSPSLPAIHSLPLLHMPGNHRHLPSSRTSFVTWHSNLIVWHGSR